MGKVIGYKGSPDDRRAEWLTMLMTKDSYQTYKGSADPIEQQYARTDNNVYNSFLGQYVA